MANEYTYLSETEKEKRNHIVKISHKKVDINIDYLQVTNCPKILYKYYSSNEYGFDVLRNGEVFASTPFYFNDPFDSSDLFWRGENFPYHAVKEFLKGRLDPEQIENYKTINELKKLFSDIIKEFFGIYCLNDGTQEDIFWGYYNDHKGFRLNFNTELLNQYWEAKPLKVEYLT
jgi:hypothetical protein